MKTGKTSVKIGYTKDSTMETYKNLDLKNLAGIDITAVDGLGNVIFIGVREGENGHRIELNGKVLSLTD